MRHLRYRRALWLPALLCAAFATIPAAAQDTESDIAFLVAKGRVTFKIYCQNCHGEAGHGDGKLADLLRIPPADLTVLAKENRGRFPAEKVRKAIDGREEVKGHGIREMPVWGDVFQESLRPTWKEVSDEQRAETKIDELVRFLESIQVLE